MAIKEVLNNVKELLRMALAGFEGAASNDPRQRRPGLMNLVVFGRAVTQGLQRLRSIAPDFDDWYRPRIEKLANDPLWVYFNQLRNRILKEAELPTANVTVVDHLDGTDMARLMAHPPPGAKSFFFGDQLGGNGWEVELPDGTIEHFYVDLPSDIAVRSSLVLADAPTEHAGAPIPDASIETLGRLYIESLTRLVDEAVQRFGR